MIFIRCYYLVSKSNNIKKYMIFQIILFSSPSQVRQTKHGSQASTIASTSDINYIEGKNQFLRQCMKRNGGLAGPLHANFLISILMWIKLDSNPYFQY